MDSVPPATIHEADPVDMVWTARMIALREEAHTLLIVVHGTLAGREAPSAHWRAGACPRLCIPRQYEVPTLTMGGPVLCREDIAKIYLVDFLGFYARDSFESRCSVFSVGQFVMSSKLSLHLIA